MSTRSPGRINLHVLWALMLRESRMAFGTSHWGYLWAIMQPSVTLTFLILVFVLIGRGAPFGESLALFFATAILCLEYFNKTSVSLMRSFSSNASLFAYPLVERLDTVIARFLLVSSIHGLIWLIFHAVLIATGYGLVPWRPELAVAAFIATGMIGLAMGLLNAVIFSFFSSWQHFEKLFGRPLFFLSGTFYVPSLLPPEAVGVIWWNPILHVVELARMGFYSDYHSEVFSASYLLWVIGIMMLAGLFAERFTRKAGK